MKLEPGGVPTRNLEQYKELHKQKVYGQSSARRLPWLMPWVHDLAPSSILDYGAGQSSIARDIASRIGAKSYAFDPGVPKIAKVPRDAASGVDLVLCLHVLEHLDESEVRPVLEQMQILSKNAIIMVPDCHAKQILGNGENAHSTVQPREWWVNVVSEFYDHVGLIPSRVESDTTMITWIPKRTIKVRTTPASQPGIRHVASVKIGGRRYAGRIR